MRWPRPRLRGSLIGCAIAIVLLVVAAVVVRATSAGDDDSSAPPSIPPPPSTVAAAVLPGSSGDVPSDSVSLTTLVPVSTVAAQGTPGDVEVPVDPSGVRSDRGEAAARQAAIDYVTTVRQRLVYLTETAGQEVLVDWAAPGVSEATIAGEVDQAAMIRGQLSADGGEVWWLVSPLASRVDANSGGRVRVAVWLSAVVGAGADPSLSNQSTQPMVRFQTDTVELVWAEGRWTVWSVTSVDGPTPMVAPSQGVTTAEAFITSMDGFSLIRRHQQ